MRVELEPTNWQRLEQILDASRPGPKSKIGDRELIDAVLYRAKTGIPWRDLPERFGPWKTAQAARHCGGRMAAVARRTVHLTQRQIHESTVPRDLLEPSNTRAASTPRR